MIKTPTLFVLGAGASAPYGYPLGADLITEILRLTTPAAGAFWTLLLAEYHQPKVEEFHKALAESDPRSIDDFLESNPQFLDIGKICIAAALTVFGPPHDHAGHRDLHWYQYLWQLMHAEAATDEQFRGNAVKVVTYNYDESFERYFRTRLAAMYPHLERRGATEEFLNEVLPVVHVHGSLGAQDSRVRPEAERAGFNNIKFYSKAASGIRIVHEDERTEEYTTAHSWLKEAKVVCLLGFGYHPTNIRRLRFKEQVHAGGARWTFVGGTCYGLKEAERQRALNLFDVGFRGDEFPFFDAKEFLRQKFVW